MCLTKVDRSCFDRWGCSVFCDCSVSAVMLVLMQDALFSRVYTESNHKEGTNCHPECKRGSFIQSRNDSSVTSISMLTHLFTFISLFMAWMFNAIYRKIRVPASYICWPDATLVQFDCCSLGIFLGKILTLKIWLNLECNHVYFWTMCFSLSNRNNQLLTMDYPDFWTWLRQHGLPWFLELGPFSIYLMHF